MECLVHDSDGGDLVEFAEIQVESSGLPISAHSNQQICPFVLRLHLWSGIKIRDILSLKGVSNISCLGEYGEGEEEVVEVVSLYHR